MDRVTGISLPTGQSVGYSYDDAGQRLSLTSAAGTVGYSYDEAGRLNTVTDPQGGVTRYLYDNLGLPTRMTQPNGVFTTYSYDQRDRLTLSETYEPYQMNRLAAFGYQYDAVGSRVASEESLNGVFSRLAWTYDAANRLTSETRRNGSDALLTQTRWTYDATGNRLTQNTDGLPTTYNYNSLDQLTSLSNSAGTATFGYDGRGNRINATTGTVSTTFGFDALDRLANVSLSNGQTFSYGYDAAGRRVDQFVGSAVTHYVWDELSAYGDVIAEVDGSNRVTAGYTLGMGHLISQSRDGSASYYTADALGSTRALTDSTAAITDTYSYSAFGEMFGSTGDTVNPYLYAGQQYDAGTGLYSLRARYYDPSAGRFLSRDTYPVNFGNPRELNRYAYVANNPINKFDPSGNVNVATLSLQMHDLVNERAAPLAVIGAATYSMMQYGYVYLQTYAPWLTPSFIDYMIKLINDSVKLVEAIQYLVQTYAGPFGDSGPRRIQPPRIQPPLGGSDEWGGNNGGSDDDGGDGIGGGNFFIRIVPEGATFDVAFGVGRELPAFANSFSSPLAFYYLEWPDSLIRQPNVLADDVQGAILKVDDPDVFRTNFALLMIRIRDNDFIGTIRAIRFNLQGLTERRSSLTMDELTFIAGDVKLLQMTQFYDGASNRLQEDQWKQRLEQLGITIAGE